MRNNIFDARNFFNPGGLPPFRRNQFGASLGGRLVRDKIFFFLNYEGLRQRQGVTNVSTVPDLDARAGYVRDPVTGQLPAVPITINPAVIPYLNLNPPPNGQNLGGGVARYSKDVSEARTEDYSMGRVDFNLSEKDSLYLRTVIDPSNSLTPGSFEPFFTSGEVDYKFVVLSETHIFSPASLNEFRFAFNRTNIITTSGPIVFQNHELDFFPSRGLGTIILQAPLCPARP